jgi:hypothetical protein
VPCFERRECVVGVVFDYIIVNAGTGAFFVAVATTLVGAIGLLAVLRD